jgi:hypothetical protein
MVLSKEGEEEEEETTEHCPCNDLGNWSRVHSTQHTRRESELPYEVQVINHNEIQTFNRGLARANHGRNCSICRSSLQAPNSAEQDGFIRPVSHKAITVEDVLIHSGQCCVGGPWGAGEDSGTESLRYGPNTQP